jgi:hypothetical protein
MEAAARGLDSPGRRRAGSGPRLPRRALLRRLAAAAGAALAGQALAACALPALPRRADTVVELTFGTYPWTGTAARLLAEGAAGFEARTRGIRLRTVAAPTDPAELLSAVLSGTGPDVFWAQDYGRLVEAGALWPLDERLDRDRVDTSQWPAAKVHMLRGPVGTFGLPASTGVMCYAVRLQDWDDLGLPAPDPGWSHEQFVAEAKRLTLGPTSPAAGGAAASARRRYGACLQWYTTGLADNAWAFPGFGGAQINPDGASSTLSTPGSLAAGRWLYEELLWPGYACTLDQTWKAGLDLANGGVAMLPVGPWSVAAHAADWGARFRWDYYPFPAFPQGRATYANSDFFAIAATTRHPEAAWQLLLWVAADPAWQRWTMRVGLLPPGSVGLWEEWEAQVRAVAPPLAGKALHHFGDAARGGYGYPQAYYRYRSDQAQAVADGFFARLWQRQFATVAAAFAAADQAVNAFLNAAAEQAAAEARARQDLARRLAAGNRNLPLPADDGPPQSPPPGSVALRPGGTVVVQGGGAGLGGTADAGLLYGAEVLAAEAEVACRLTALRTGTCPYLADEAVAGLMVRAGLAPDAPFVAVGATAGRGVLVAVRPAAGLPARTWTGADHPGPGLEGPATLTRAGRAKADDALLHPLWLRVVRRGATWTCLTSADGIRWAQAGPSLTAPMGGCWAGPFVAAHNRQTGLLPGQTVRAEFADVRPAPQRAVQIGPA